MSKRQQGFDPYADFEASCRMFADELYAAQNPNRLDQFRQGAKEAGRVFLVGAVALTMGHGATGSALPNAFEWHNSTPDCGSLDTGQIEATRAFLQEPDNLFHNQAERTIGFRNLEMNGYFSFVFEIAKQHNLTLVDPSEHRERLGYAYTTKEVTGVLNDFGREYGLEFDFVVSETELDNRAESEADKGDEPIKNKEIDPQDLKNAARMFMNNFYLMPKELVELSQVKTVRILKTLGPVDKDKDGDGAVFSIAGKAYGATDAIALTYDAFVGGDPTIYMHEFSHKIDQAICGEGRYNDTAFDELNPDSFDYGKNSWPNEATSSEYGSTALIEDKAEIGELVIPRINFQTMYELDSSHVDQKVHLWLTRLEGKIPGIVAYFAAISHPAHKQQVYGPPNPVPGMP